METNELNKFIKHYLEDDNTHSAIMLTAPWGTGKSYYLQNELIPFIDSDDQKKCIVISLYGLKELQEISKSIYLEVRAKVIAKKSEKLSAGKIIGKTIIKGVASFFGVDLDISQEDLNKLYESIDLSGKLIILEDLERSQIDIIEILGYVNNLVEQDGVKVLLVANEKEILKYEEQEVNDATSKNNGKKTIKVLTKDSEKYLEVKEKTISDTIHFYGNTKNSITNILRGFNNPILKSFANENDTLNRCVISLEIYEEIMRNNNIQSENLRAFIYACQKTSDMFDSVDNKLNVEFAKKLFMSIIAFCLRKKKRDNILWGNNKYIYSSDLGTSKYPLLDYCYYFICVQYNYPKELKTAEQNFIEQRVLEEQQKLANVDIEIIYSFYNRKELEVIQAVKNIKELLKINKIIDTSQYGKLANYIIAIKEAIGCEDDIDECKKLMLKNLLAVKEDITNRISFHDGYELNGTAKEEFNDFKQEMLSALKQKQKDPFNFDYSIYRLGNFCEQIYEKRSEYISNHVFARKVNNDKLIELLSQCNALQISEIRGMYLHVYSFSNINEYFMEDKDTLIELKQKIENLVKTSTKFDKIQIMQLNWFIKNLEGIIDRLQENN